MNWLINEFTNEFTNELTNELTNKLIFDLKLERMIRWNKVNKKSVNEVFD